MKTPSLSEYKRKRDFRKTPEPAGKTRKRKTKELSFVVQEHHATRLHWDFRLELDGALKSWAVPKGPSMDPKDRRLAVQVEDHPLEYGSFEGEIPSGEYGAGQVVLWDRGTWTPLSDPRKSLRKGKLEFLLNGDRLKGKWVLVRTKNKESGKLQWLLIKRSDEYSEIDILEKERIDATPEFTSPQLALLVKKPPQGPQWLHEVKFDGYRLQAHLQNGKVRLFTRTGQDWTEKFAPLVADLRKIRTAAAVLDGELVALGADGRSDFQLLQNLIKSHKTGELFFYAFDLLHLNGEDLRSLPLIERKQRLERLLKPLKNSSLQYSPHVVGEIDLLESICNRRLEGVVSKRLDSLYSSGRVDTWRKTKCERRQEFVIGGYTAGRGGREPFGALLLGIYENNRLRYVGKAGTGFTEQSQRELLRALKRLKRTRSPFEKNAPRIKGAHWVSPKLVAEISFANWTQGGRLRIPVFHGLREDRPAASVRREEPEDRSAGSVPLTNPEKIYFQKEAVTKKQVAEYILAAAPWILPHLRNRPLSLVRCPNGTGRKCFFQKHPPEMDKNPALIPVLYGGDPPYVIVDSAEGLVALVQLGALELHAWNSRAPVLDRPDQIVMDFDPGPGVAFGQVKAACLELKQMLERLDLKSFVKVTGGKGLHVHIPIAPRYEWDEVKSFAHTLARAMVQNRPKLYTTRMTKSKRNGKIFIDYLRNGEGATAIAPYSLRAREVSAVALPISWRQLKVLKDPSQFTLRKALAHLKKRKQDPWSGYDRLAQKIALIEASGKPFVRKNAQNRHIAEI